MCPGVVGDKGELFVLSREAAVCVEFQRLCIRLQRLHLCVGYSDASHLKLRLLIEKHTQHIAGVVGPLGTIDQRTTLYGGTSAVGCHTSVGTHQTRLHVEVHAHLVALLPLALYGHISII